MWEVNIITKGYVDEHGPIWKTGISFNYYSAPTCKLLLHIVPKTLNINTKLYVNGANLYIMLIKKERYLFTI